jgi:hypothetical protein
MHVRRIEQRDDGDTIRDQTKVNKIHLEECELVVRWLLADSHYTHVGYYVVGCVAENYHNMRKPLGTLQ